MVRHENEDAVTYTVVVTPAQDSIPAATLQIKMRKFKAEVRVTYLQWSRDFRELNEQADIFTQTLGEHQDAFVPSLLHCPEFVVQIFTEIFWHRE